MDKVAPGVRLLSVCQVAPVPVPVPALALVENTSNVKVKLSFLDAPWVATPPLQQIFLYERGDGDESGAAVVERLKESLAASFAFYLPLAGKLTYMEETGDMVVDCSQPEVAFFEAEAEAAGGCPEDMVSLVPQHDARVLPAPVLTVQATLFSGGLALGVSFHHAVVDGRGFLLFMDAWSSISRGRGGSPDVTRSLTPGPACYGREVIAHPCSDELAHEVLNKVAPNLPLVIKSIQIPIHQAILFQCLSSIEDVIDGSIWLYDFIYATNKRIWNWDLAPQANATEDYFSHRSQLERRVFVLVADNIRTLKRRIGGLASPSSAEVVAKPKPVSTFVALSALSWTAFVNAKGLAAGEDAYLLFQVDVRARLRPPVGAGYFGNCVRGCIASADAGELLGEAGLLHASRAIQAAVREVLSDPLAGIGGTWVERAMELPVARRVYVAGSPLFRVYQTADFGFGMPSKVVHVSVAGFPETPAGHASTMKQSGRMVLVAGKRDGEVHLSVSLDPVRMVAFRDHIDACVANSKPRSKF